MKVIWLRLFVCVSVGDHVLRRTFFDNPFNSFCRLPLETVGRFGFHLYRLTTKPTSRKVLNLMICFTSYANVESNFDNHTRDIYIKPILTFDFQVFYFVHFLGQCTNFFCNKQMHNIICI